MGYLYQVPIAADKLMLFEYNTELEKFNPKIGITGNDHFACLLISTGNSSQSSSSSDSIN
jgi:hypothetical protein